jgi:phospholipid/cholesterol/gamma-HCH transport system substrate-binding protein
VFPILGDAARAMHALADTVQGVAQGHGNVGRLMNDETLANQITQMLANLKTATDQLNATLTDVKQTITTVNGPEGVPTLLHRADAALASVQRATHDLASATPRLPAITRDLSTTTSDLPALMTQTQATADELEKTLNQLRHTWPLSGSATAEPRRLPPSEVRP